MLYGELMDAVVDSDGQGTAQLLWVGLGNERPEGAVAVGARGHGVRTPCDVAHLAAAAGTAEAIRRHAERGEARTLPPRGAPAAKV